MRFFCNGCEKEKDFHLDYGVLVIAKWGAGIQRFCRSCRSPRAYVPDVFFDGKPEENLADLPNGKPRSFGSKGEKAAYLKMKGLKESGDRVHGAPLSFASQHPRLDSKAEVQNALKKVMQMSPSARHREYLRITKGRHA